MQHSNLITPAEIAEWDSIVDFIKALSIDSMLC